MEGYQKKPKMLLEEQCRGERGEYSLFRLQYRRAEAWVLLMETESESVFGLWQGDGVGAEALYHAVVRGEVAAEHLHDVISDAERMAEFF